MIQRHRGRLVLQVILLDEDLRHEVEQYLQEGGFTVMRSRHTPYDVSLGFIAAAVEITVREREVLEALLEHDTAARIAQALGISPRTVEGHLLDLMRRLGVHSRHRIIVRAISLGLLQVAPSE